MAKIALLSDVHGNKPALTAVLEDMPSVDEIWFAGDAVGYHGNSNAVCRTLEDVADKAVFGNHEAREREDFTFIPESDPEVREHKLLSENLSDDARVWINTLPRRVERGNIVMAHNNPFVEPYHGFPAIEQPYFDKRHWPRDGDGFDGIALMGHIHDSGHLDRSKFDGRSGLLVNGGAVGQPRDGPAEYAVIDTDGRSVDHRSVVFDYDVSEYNGRIQNTPSRLGSMR